LCVHLHTSLKDASQSKFDQQFQSIFIVTVMPKALSLHSYFCLSFRSEVEESAFAFACSSLFVIPEGNLLPVRSQIHYTNDEKP